MNIIKCGAHAAIEMDEWIISNDGKIKREANIYIGTVISAPGDTIEPFDDDQIVIAAGVKGTISGWSHSPLIVAAAERFREPTAEDWQRAEIWQ